MSLRYRLFLWVSGLFVVVAIASLFIESYVTRRELAVAQKNLKEKLVSISEGQRKDLENFLSSSIAEKQVMLDAILNNISIFVPQILRFGPTGENVSQGTWNQASELLMDHKWIDFLQSTNEGKLSSAIIPENRLLDDMYRVPIADGISWVYVRSTPDPYLAVEVPFTYFNPDGKSDEGLMVQHATEFIPVVYLLFDPKTLQPLASVSPSALAEIPAAWTEGFSLQVAAFYRWFQEISAPSFRQQLHTPPLTQAQVAQKFDLSDSSILNMIPGGMLLSTASTEKYMHDRLEETSLRFLQINMIWMLISMAETGIFGPDFFSSQGPVAIALFSSQEEIGMGLKTSDVFFKNPRFDDQHYYTTHAPVAPNSMLATSLAVITHAQEDHAYLGNTAAFELEDPQTKQMRTGYLTLAVDADTLLQNLVLALHKSILLVYEGKIVSAFGGEGNKLTHVAPNTFPLNQMLGQQYGLVNWQQERYFFLHMQPFPTLDLHFFMLNPEKVEFALLRDLEQGSENVVHSMLLDLHVTGIIALLITILVLHNISRRITEPIIALANMTKDIVKGNYDCVKMNLPIIKHQDEIAVLCRSFEEMVNGLIEREKVKGVLNKVVSSEIAQEILKGNVHLGGEEKRATVLFADIRGFTKITQHMSPEQVIGLLNTCMTKISAPIEHHGGVIDKYVGDEVMALFGAPLAQEDSALKAIQTALEMVQILRTWNEELQKQNHPLIEMGISIHTGAMLAGNMGAENRLNYTVLGSNVNLASRLCDVAHGMQILVTQDVLQEPHVKESVVYETLPPVQFKGFDTPVPVFAVTGLR